DVDGVGVAALVVVVLTGAKPHFLPLLFGFDFLWWRLPLPGHAFWLLCGTPPLSAELRTGKAAARPRQVAKTANLRVLSFTSSVPPWLIGSPLRKRRGAPGGYSQAELGEQADLAEDRDRVRVDVLALDQAVLVGDHVDPAPLDPGARRLVHQAAA